MKNSRALEAVEFAKELQRKGTPPTDGEIDKLCKMAGVKLYRNVDVVRDFKNGRFVRARTRRTKNPNRKFFTPPELGKMIGRSGSTIRRMFRNDPGVKRQVFAGRGRRRVVTLLIPRDAIKERFPDLEI